MIKIERIIYNTAFVQFFVNKSRKMVLPGFQGLPLYKVAKFFFSQVKKVGLNDRARSISFSFLTAIPAATIFICTLIPYLPVSQQIENQLLFVTHDITPNQNTYLLVKQFLSDFLDKPRVGLLSFGFLLALFYSSNAMLGIMRSFDKSLLYNRRRNMLQSRWMAIKLTLLVLFIVIGSVLMLVTQAELMHSFLKWMHVTSHSAKWWLFRTVRWVIIIPLFYFAIACIYKYGPAVHKRWKLFSPGCLLATCLTILTTLLFSYWVNRFGNYNKVYGSIGTIMILMVLIYFNSLVLLIGYELNVSIHHLKHAALQSNAAKAR
ncbi:MAG: YihY/virulence factor BrkB family protein [Bacteroidota bacterium]|nr:YihY/virulence factor BrkB family protein [Bacteroidota bacterium]MDP4214909.1 YihY/virulence factor BrkB family protein [Bacteroidota bacterium]MDP4246360.1 YihY/virulence factor BrkB family protein [Bacteroidota bacterium]MDP4254369.1 YihY/virulence factor BrkB family protein [Bacteroidota bacterium]MDP4258836.1 YihY/virulence factor BrkB family protein [Bacteroidota bacterium]